jgi:hypothetical protein
MRVHEREIIREGVDWALAVSLCSTISYTAA